MQTISLLENEDGHLAIITAMFILALLTVISISASRVANTEITIARNEVIYRRNFYLAEGAALEAADHLTRYGNLRENRRSWMEMNTGELNMESVKQYWDNTAINGDSTIPEPSVVDQNHTLFIIGHEGTARGFSINMDRPTVHSIAIFGRCAWNGISVIKLGYNAAY
jgi:Tfp pilus assembly protein PilX